MILTRAPVRFSLGGGGTDLPAYYRHHGGFVVSAAVDKYIYLTANQRFSSDIHLAYWRTETVRAVDEIQHPLFREALACCGVTGAIELTSSTDVPPHSGLGSSGAFLVALLAALHAHQRRSASPAQLAEMACDIEIDRLGQPVGKQDQYISAFGGVSAITIDTDGSVHVEPVPAREEVLDELQSNLAVFYTGVERQAATVLREQVANVEAGRRATTDGMHRIKALGREVYRLLVDGDVDRYGELLHEHWQRKRALASSMSDPLLDEHYEAARKAGAVGGKIMGAGGGGFFLFYVRSERRRTLSEAMIARGLRPLPFRFDHTGACVVANLRR